MTLFLSPHAAQRAPAGLSTFAAFGLDLHAIQDLVTRYGWWGILFLMALQGATMPVPNEITMPLAGWLLVESAGKSKLLILFAGLVGAVGWVIGALIAYTVMAIGGRTLLARLRRRSPAAERALRCLVHAVGSMGGILRAAAADLADDHYLTGGRGARTHRAIHAGDVRRSISLVHLSRCAWLRGGQSVGSRARSARSVVSSRNHRRYPPRCRRVLRHRANQRASCGTDRFLNALSHREQSVLGSFPVSGRIRGR